MLFHNAGKFSRIASSFRTSVIAASSICAKVFIFVSDSPRTWDRVPLCGSELTALFSAAPLLSNCFPNDFLHGAVRQRFKLSVQRRVHAVSSRIAVAKHV